MWAGSRTPGQRHSRIRHTSRLHGYDHQRPTRPAEPPHDAEGRSRRLPPRGPLRRRCARALGCYTVSMTNTSTTTRYASVQRIIDAIGPSGGNSARLLGHYIYAYPDGTFWVQFKLPGQDRLEGISGNKEKILRQMDEILTAMAEAAA